MAPEVCRLAAEMKAVFKEVKSGLFGRGIAG